MCVCVSAGLHNFRDEFGMYCDENIMAWHLEALHISKDRCHTGRDCQYL